MSWQTPRTWSPGETVTASLMNAHLRDQLNALEAKAIVVQIGNQLAGTIPTGIAAWVEIPVSLEITGWTLLGNAAGSIVIDVWLDSYANHPPTVADTIAGTEKPTLSSAQKNQDLSLTTWSPDVDAGDVMYFNVDSCTGISQCTLTLRAIPR